MNKAGREKRIDRGESNETGNGAPNFNRCYHCLAEGTTVLPGVPQAPTHRFSLPRIDPTIL